jgi:tetratricopeptide (TPR) repeat protein
VDTRSLYVAGGVQMRLQPRAGAIDRYADPIADALEAAVSAFPGDRFALAVPFSVPLARQSGNDGSSVGVSADARRAMDKGDYRQAAALLRRAIDGDPLDLDAWTGLARAEVGLGDARAARAAVARAFELEPNDPLTRVTAFEVEHSIDAQGALSGLDPAARRALGQDYVSAALASLHAENRHEAMRLCNAALDVDSNNAEALMARFLVRDESDTSARRRDVVRAIRSLRESLRTGTESGVQQRLAFALTSSATQRTLRATSALVAAIASGSQSFDTFDAVNDLGSAAAEAREARELDPELPLAPGIEAIARGVRVALMRAEGLSAESARAQQIADETIARFPKHPAGYYARAILYVIEEDPASAGRKLDQALEIDPTDARALALRAMVNNMLGDCAASQRDFERARVLRMPFTPDDERMLKECVRG